MKKPIRYIRIENESGGKGRVINWAELQAITLSGENLLLGILPMPLRNNQNSPYKDPENITDGTTSTAGYTFGINFLKYDLGRIVTNLEMIRFAPGYDGVKYTKILVSDDELTWYTILESYQHIASTQYIEAIVPEVDDLATPDTTPPNFDYIQDLTLEYGAKFDPLHNVVALDDRDGDITNRIIIVGSVDTSVVGKHVLTYIVSDKSGNMTVKERTITVLPENNLIPALELQKDIFVSLNDGTYPVHEVIPAQSAMPYIQLGNITKFDSMTKTNRTRHTLNVMIHGWSKGNSSVQSKEIEFFIYQKIMALEMAKFNVDLVELTMSESLKEENGTDGTIFHTIQEFEITVSGI